MSFDREQMKEKAAALAAKGIYVGTSSWKYEGWFGQLYTPERYEYRGKFAKTRFERDCLGECSEVFKTASVDAAYYTFPNTEYHQPPFCISGKQHMQARREFTVLLWRLCHAKTNKIFGVHLPVLPK